MQIPPASVLETWPAPNYDSPVRRGHGAFITNLVLYPLALLFLLLRVYTRVRITKSFGTDDVFILLAMIPATVFFVLSTMVDRHYNLFLHTWDIPLPKLSLQLKFNIIAECVFGLAFTFTKLSVLQLVRRVLERSTSKARLVLLIAMGLIICEGLVFMFTVIFQCSPVAAYWTLSVGPQNCTSEKANILVADLLNTITSLIVVILPIYFIWNLNLPVRQVSLVCSLFALSLVVVVSGVIRTVFFYHLTSIFDKSWAAYWVWLFSEVELYTGILCACIPPAQPFFMKNFPKAFGYLYLSSKQAPSSSMTLPITYECTVEPPQQPNMPTLPLSTRKEPQRNFNSERRGSRITVDDEVLISYEISSSRARDVDVESGSLEKNGMDVQPLAPLAPLALSKKKKGRSKLSNEVVGEKTVDRKTAIYVRIPGIDGEFLENRPSTESHHSISFMKPGKAKLVRIDVENIRIKHLTPESDWGSSSASGSGRLSFASSIFSSRTGPEIQKADKQGGRLFRLSTWGTEKERKGSDESQTSNKSRIVKVTIDQPMILPSPQRAVFAGSPLFNNYTAFDARSSTPASLEREIIHEEPVESPILGDLRIPLAPLSPLIQTSGKTSAEFRRRSQDHIAEQLAEDNPHAVRRSIDKYHNIESTSNLKISNSSSTLKGKMREKRESLDRNSECSKLSSGLRGDSLTLGIHNGRLPPIRPKFVSPTFSQKSLREVDQSIKRGFA